MNESALYLLRLSEVCLAAFFVLHQGLALVVMMISSSVLRYATRLRSSTGAQLLFVLRVFPITLSVSAVLAFCIPSYLRFEHDAKESTSLACLLLAVAGLTVLTNCGIRIFRALVLSRKLRENLSVFPAFGLVGIFRPRIFVSPNVHRALTPTQMEVAILHEAAHCSAHDNLKRLAIIASPRLLPFTEFHKAIETHWARLAECAADESAVANEPCRAIDLADALLRVARLSSSHSRAISAISTLVARQEDLAYRIEILLNLSYKEPTISYTPRLQALLATALLVFIVVPFLPAVQYIIHRAMEQLVH